MLAVASLLDQEHTDKVNQIVNQLDTIFGLKGVQLTPYPHLTWLTTDVAKMSDLKDYLRKLSEQSQPLTARTMGIGIFPGDKPVIYIPDFAYPRNQPFSRAAFPGNRRIQRTDRPFLRPQPLDAAPDPGARRYQFLEPGSGFTLPQPIPFRLEHGTR